MTLIAQTIKGYNARKSDTAKSVRPHGRPIGITTVQGCALTTGATMKIFFTSVQEEIDHTQAKNMLKIIGDRNAKVRNKAEQRIGLRVGNEAGK